MAYLIVGGSNKVGIEVLVYVYHCAISDTFVLKYANWLGNLLYSYLKWLTFWLISNGVSDNVVEIHWL